MMMTMERDPYDCGFRPGKFATDYVGRESGWYVLKLNLEGHRSLDACMFQQRDVYNWLFDNCDDEHFFVMQASCPDPDYPSLTLCEADGRNCYVLLDRFSDLISFDQKFRIRDLDNKLTIQ